MSEAGGAEDEAQTSTPVEKVEHNADEAGDTIKIEEAESSAPRIPDDQWKGMTSVLTAIYAHREEDGHDPNKIFQRMVNKRQFPDYFDVIKEPMALSKIRTKISAREYSSFPEFVRDCALIVHNAHVYNLPESGAYQDATLLKPVFESEIQKLVESNTISAHHATWPDLGEIPAPSPHAAEDDEEDDEDDEEEEDEEPDDSDDEGNRRRRSRRGHRSMAATAKRESGSKEDKEKATDPDSRKKRGRPPRVDTPLEARIKAVLKGIRKFKDDSGQFKTHWFEKMPDKAQMPEYYQEIKEPMALDLIKRKAKRKKYNSVDHFMKDMDTMFNNAQSYNTDDSQIFKDAKDLQIEARNLAEAEKKKPDSEYMMEDGRLPLPEGIEHNNEVWKVGDWVHIQNPNDVTKPIVAQIYRTWQDSEGQKWVNACWYYRPEQTVHQFEKHFFPNEVVKTGQYRDHHIDEVIDRCFVMFFTRYYRGRPRNFPTDKEVYVCEARYNEEKFKLNKIKTWASCLPDEVRDKDYEMNIFEQPKKVKKVPSPIKHLLKEDAKETDDLPKPTWGAENAPPIVGAVHRRPREENESPPPEPTPSPPPPPPPQPARPPPVARTSTSHSLGGQSNANMGSTPNSQRMPSQTTPQPPHLQAATQTHSAQSTVTPAPSYAAGYASHPSTYAPQIAPSSYSQQTPLPNQTHPNQYSTPSRPANWPQDYLSSAQRSVPGYPSMAVSHTPRTVEVFALAPNANESIPADIRNQYQQDAQGRLLFFSQPPLDPVPPVNPEARRLCHTTAYLAAKKKRDAEIAEHKRKFEADRPTREAEAKKRRLEEEKALAEQKAKDLNKMLLSLAGQMVNDTEQIYASIFPDDIELQKKAEMENLERFGKSRKDTIATNMLREEHEKKFHKVETIDLKETGKPKVYLDDTDPRIPF